MKISYGAVVPLPPDEAFAFVSEPTTWPTFFESMRSVEKGDDWGAVGGHARMINVRMGREIGWDLELTVWDPPREFSYRASQSAGPLVDNRRVLEPVAGGTQLSGTSEIAVRPGLSGLGDRVMVWVLQRTYAKAMQRLPEVVGQTPRTRSG
jgi:carbon monoxide dehydrogenase subunit G